MDAGLRRCSRCDAALSRYNPASVCAKCSRSTVEVAEDFWHAEPLRTALLRWDVGTLVRLYRRRTGLSQSSVAALVSIDQSEVSRLERGKKTVRDRRQLLTWTTALGVPEGLVSDLPVDSSSASQTFLAAVSGVTPPAALGIGSVEDQARSIEDLVIDFQQRDNQLGGNSLLAEAEQHLQQVLHLASVGNGTSASDRSLNSAAAQLAQMAGWLYLDAGQPAEARRNLTTALYAAHLTGDLRLAGSVLGYMSLTALYHGSPSEALALARTAHDSGHASGEGRTGAMLSTRLARALAENGQHTEARSALHVAERSFNCSSPDEPVWLAYFDEGELLAQQGTTLMKVGALSEARDCLGDALGHLRAGHTNNVRDQVNYLIRLADIAVAAGDLDEACSHASEALTLNGQISSTRMQTNIKDFLSRLSPHGAARSVRTLTDRASAVGIVH